LCASTWDRKYGWRHAKRPGVEKFLKDLSRYYELVIFTSNIGGIADPIIQALDKDNVVFFRLYREATKFENGAHIKDLSVLNRDLRKVIILDDDPAAYQLQPRNAIHIKVVCQSYDTHFFLFKGREIRLDEINLLLPIRS
jgi:import inner membrane translocase subunit TIM50